LKAAQFVFQVHEVLYDVGGFHQGQTNEYQVQQRGTRYSAKHEFGLDDTQNNFYRGDDQKDPKDLPNPTGSSGGCVI
jgi:hypothetical protein